MDPLIQKYQLVHEAFNPDALKLLEAEEAWQEGDGSLVLELSEDLKLEFLKRLSGINYVQETPQGLVVEGSVSLYDKKLTRIPWNFYSVTDEFDCGHNDLVSLEGCPRIVGKRFACDHNQLESLEYCPETVGGSFFCSHNHLTSLYFSPEYIDGNFYCDENLLTDLKGAPREVNGTFDCSRNPLTSLEGAPKKVWGDFNCYNFGPALGHPETIIYGRIND